MTVAQAVEHIQSRRRIAMPNLGFFSQLQEYYEMNASLSMIPASRD